MRQNARIHSTARIHSNRFHRSGSYKGVKGRSRFHRSCLLFLFALAHGGSLVLRTWNCLVQRNDQNRCQRLEAAWCSVL